ncbi:hypothetical protein TIFTF001_051097 [Ficus carica]|uniref:Uncharacterized protein n=1 Tax=Ficus carica TaxID=3494 RepID=A0AA87Z438_FICCA|nr:hypothetical protein TIFTF001_051095 [Ficus carica]GMN21301.1 hypothetical protein TIFTF001_051097 [Ficus carica]
MAPAPEGAPANFCINIYTVFREDQDHDPNMKVPISIFNVPKSLTASKPDAYVPRLVGWDLALTCDQSFNICRSTSLLRAVSPISVLNGYPPYKALRHLLHHLVALIVSPEKNPEEEQLEERFIEDM